MAQQQLAGAEVASLLVVALTDPTTIDGSTGASSARGSAIQGLRNQTVVFTQRFVMVLHNRIGLFRAERAASRRELADAVGVNHQTIGYLERGDYKPSLELAMKIAAYFEVPIELLFSFEPFEPVSTVLRRAASSKEGDRHGDRAEPSLESIK